MYHVDVYTYIQTEPVCVSLSVNIYTFACTQHTHVNTRMQVRVLDGQEGRPGENAKSNKIRKYTNQSE